MRCERINREVGDQETHERRHVRRSRSFTCDVVIRLDGDCSCVCVDPPEYSGGDSPCDHIRGNPAVDHAPGRDHRSVTDEAPGRTVTRLASQQSSPIEIERSTRAAVAIPGRRIVDDAIRSDTHAIADGHGGAGVNRPCRN